MSTAGIKESETMLQFGMETRRINEIISKGAKNRISDIAFLTKELNKWLVSQERRRQIEADQYYDYEQEILRKQRKVIGEDGNFIIDKKLPNHRYIDNQYGKMVDQKVNYLLSKPITFKTDDERYNDLLQSIFNRRFHRTIKNVGKDSYNGAIAFLHPYYDEQGEFKLRRFHPWEIKVFWKDDDKTEIDFFWRYYELEGYEGDNEKIYRYLDVYDQNGVHHFEYDKNGLVPEYSHAHLEYSGMEHNWNRVPLVAFKSNSTCTPLLKKCKSLQDGINQILSEFGDGMEENASGNSIIVIKNYDGENLGVFRRNLSQYKAVKVRTVDGADGGIDKLEITVNAENYKVILQELRKALIQNCKGYDVEELKSSGSPNEMTIKSIYSDIDLDANEIETEYQASFEELLWFINQHLAMTGQGTYAAEQVEVIFNRDMMVNESQVITDISNSSGLLSKRTLVSMHPWVSDVQAELDEMKKEEEEQMEQFGNSFVRTVEDDENAEE